MKTIGIISLICLLNFVAFGQAPAKTTTVVIQTSAQCGDCKERIEGALNLSKGIKSVELDMESKKVTVVYKNKKTNFDNICKVLNDTGYDADGHKAVPAAVQKLPKCCQPGGH